MRLTELLDLEDVAHRSFSSGAPDEAAMNRFIRQRQHEGSLDIASVGAAISLGQLILALWNTFSDRRKGGERKPFITCPTCKGKAVKVIKAGRVTCENKHVWFLREK